MDYNMADCAFCRRNEHENCIDAPHTVGSERICGCSHK